MIPLRDVIPSRTTPYITVTIIVLNALAWFLELSLPREALPLFLQVYGVVPAQLHALTLLTSMFLHGSWMHVIGNMWYLWIFGDNVEDRVGHGRFIVFYLLCGIAAALGQVVIDPGSTLPTIGASGAIAGVMGAYMIKFPHSRILSLVTVLFFITTFEIPAWIMLIYWFVIQFFSGVGSIGFSHVSEGGGVAFFAHVGGFLAGMALIGLMAPRQRYSSRRDLSW
jgi:membrane associated rhomboid family serine protease